MHENAESRLMNTNSIRYSNIEPLYAFKMASQTVIYGEDRMGKFARTASAAAVLILLCASTVQAQSLVGKPAPPINAKEWLNAEEPLSLEKLKGKIVFIDFTATW